MVRECDVCVGHSGDARQMVACLRAELELLGVACVDASTHAIWLLPVPPWTRATAGVVLVTPTMLANLYVHTFIHRTAEFRRIVLGRIELV
jgi:hypothetical protein